MINSIVPISPIHSVKNSKNKHYDLDAESIYNAETGDTVGDISYMPFDEVLKKLEVGKWKVIQYGK